MEGDNWATNRLEIPSFGFGEVEWRLAGASGGVHVTDRSGLGRGVVLAPLLTLSLPLSPFHLPLSPRSPPYPRILHDSPIAGGISLSETSPGQDCGKNSISIGEVGMNHHA